jgi:hypothetical protein
MSDTKKDVPTRSVAAQLLQQLQKNALYIEKAIRPHVKIPVLLTTSWIVTKDSELSNEELSKVSFTSKIASYGNTYLIFKNINTQNTLSYCTTSKSVISWTLLAQEIQELTDALDSWKTFPNEIKTIQDTNYTILSAADKLFECLNRIEQECLWNKIAPFETGEIRLQNKWFIRRDSFFSFGKLYSPFLPLLQVSRVDSKIVTYLLTNMELHELICELTEALIEESEKEKLHQVAPRRTTWEWTTNLLKGS